MTICDEGVVDLVAAIVKQAGRDYQYAKRNLQRRPHSSSAVTWQMTVDECERFFRSDYFARMTGLDGEAVMRMLDKEVDRYEDP